MRRPLLPPSSLRHRLVTLPGVTEATVVVVGDVPPGVRRTLEAAGYKVIETDVLERLAEVEQVLAPAERPVVVIRGPSDDAVGAEEPDGDPDVGPPVVFVVDGPDEVAGALALGAHDILRVPVDPAELEVRIAAAARTARLRTEVRELARTDPLTGLFNRRFVDDHLAKASSLARRLHTPLSILMIDIDRTRRINDQHGRAAGDEVLAEVAHRVLRALRGEDVAGRWSGEEYIVLLPATSADGAWTLAERIRSSVCDEPIAISDDDDVIVTVSIGCAEGFGDDVEDQLRRVHRALDEAKTAGRNRAVVDT